MDVGHGHAKRRRSKSWTVFSGAREVARELNKVRSIIKGRMGLKEPMTIDYSRKEDSRGFLRIVE